MDATYFLFVFLQQTKTNKKQRVSKLTIHAAESNIGDIYHRKFSFYCLLYIFVSTTPRVPDIAVHHICFINHPFISFGNSIAGMYGLESFWKHSFPILKGITFSIFCWHISQNNRIRNLWVLILQPTKNSKYHTVKLSLVFNQKSSNLVFRNNLFNSLFELVIYA